MLFVHNIPLIFFRLTNYNHIAFKILLQNMPLRLEYIIIMLILLSNTYCTAKFCLNGKTYFQTFLVILAKLLRIF